MHFHCSILEVREVFQLQVSDLRENLCIPKKWRSRDACLHPIICAVPDQDIQDLANVITSCVVNGVAPVVGVLVAVHLLPLTRAFAVGCSKGGTGTILSACQFFAAAIPTSTVCNDLCSKFVMYASTCASVERGMCVPVGIAMSYVFRVECDRWSLAICIALVRIDFFSLKKVASSSSSEDLSFRVSCVCDCLLVSLLFLFILWGDVHCLF
eukprot:GHVQ01006817.1.p2 GENE.GHVQ01006817.1~~GHVQ01006817.1.p2  ORF type:complete len:211 (+),score=23.84 GHVQ01006817.1:855-1487(+)